MIEYLMLNPMVVPISMIRSGFDGTELGIDSFYIIYSIIFCLASLIFGSMVFKRSEANVVKYL
jgi:ABC-type polysaccharide/polyol phosphate export permease